MYTYNVTRENFYYTVIHLSHTHTAKQDIALLQRALTLPQRKPIYDMRALRFESASRNVIRLQCNDAQQRQRQSGMKHFRYNIS